MFELLKEGMKNSRFYGSNWQLAIGSSRMHFVPDEQQSAISIQHSALTLQCEKP
ncbi:MAG TPA: hypothetical protein VH724_12810 [Candidatus Angelobacter sp.]|jgi:hypothetical protein|nr:hypothetical protein [Candidatus Angelobacter sp.]